MAKKRYHQSVKDRLAESRGEMRHLEGDARMKADRHMRHREERYNNHSDCLIHEDHNAPSNLPQEVIMKYYPRTEYDRYNLNDDIRGIDVQMRDDMRKEKRKSGMAYPDKY